MRRADRLFQIVQLLRARRVVTAAQLAENLEVSERTIYRDVRDLVRSGVPIDGEAGIGYALPRRFDLPPLMFTRDEVEALVLGARIVKSWSDRELARAAESALEKVEAVLPDALRARVNQTALFAPDFHIPEKTTAELSSLRAAVADRRKLRLAYVRGDGERSERTVRPLALYFWGRTWTLTSWCEYRSDFRSFRLDRIEGLRVLDEIFEPEAGKDLGDYLRTVEED
jgi:predicted DNA-binding transcriptional regulator YafY